MTEPLKIIIAGSRDLRVDLDRIDTWVTWLRDSWVADGLPFGGLEIVSGGAGGIDACGEEYAQGYGYPVKKFPADWNKHGKAAGPIRNKQMALYADAALVFMKEPTPGSSNMVAWMELLEKPVKVLQV